MLIKHNSRKKLIKLLLCRRVELVLALYGREKHSVSLTAFLTFGFMLKQAKLCSAINCGH